MTVIFAKKYFYKINICIRQGCEKIYEQKTSRYDRSPYD